jgi:hypothetical protein
VRATPLRRLGELALLGLLALFAFVPIVAMVRHANAADLVYAGANGPFPGDQFQYMSWIRELSDGLLAANGFDSAPSDRVFFHPMFFVSGLAFAAGASMGVAYLLWVPVTVAALFLGFRAFVRRFLEDERERLAALALALFFASPVAALMDWGGIGSEEARVDVVSAAGELLPATLQWGYLPAAISVGLMPPFLLGVERIARRIDAGEPAGARLVTLVAVCGALSSWLHPWQGEILFVTAGGALLLGAERGRRLGGFGRRHVVELGLPLAAVAAPLLYYFALSRLDGAWELAQEANAREGSLLAWVVALAVLPLLLPALLGLRGTGRDLGERMILIWPVAALAVYVVLSPSFPQHAFEGVSLPLAILAVRGMRRLPRPGLATAALVTVLTVPGLLYMADWLNDTISAGGQPHYLSRDEDRALDYLDDAGGDGAVVATPYLASAVPARGGSQVWSGHPSWTPDFAERTERAAALFGGRLPRADAIALLRESRARYVLLDCGTPPAALAALRPALVEERRFGCARVYRVAIS